MSDIIFALKCIIMVIVFVFLAFFATYFVLANDHIVTIYINPIYFNMGSTHFSPEFELPVWQLGLIAFIVGGLIMSLISSITSSKQKAMIEDLTKENANLKSKFDKVKTDISKCVT
jgi:ABC-type phosphate transport system permease subunit